jgi:hypothetical protein
MSDPRFDTPVADTDETLESDLEASVMLTRLLRVRGRTSLRDLYSALMLMDNRLAKYARAKGERWKTYSIDSHLMHAEGHLARACNELTDRATLVKELCGAGLRICFALVCLVRRTDGRSLSSIRADATPL